jgi:CubicO group peptidase (beta-lactamase class C family)
MQFVWILLALLVAVIVFDLIQTKHAILRNFPVIGHFRYLFEAIGLGFGLSGEAICPNLFGTLTSPGTFGHYGSGSTLFWVDPELDMTFVCLSAGVMQAAPNIERFQRLSDIAASAAV